MRRKLLLKERKPCFKIRITLAIVKLSRNMPCFDLIVKLITYVNGLHIIGATEDQAIY